MLRKEISDLRFLSSLGSEDLHRPADDARQRGDSQSPRDRLVSGPLPHASYARDCRHRIEPDPAEHAARYGAELPVIDWVKRLKCSQCGSRSVDFVLTGARR
jgi:hypothetical protein